MGSDDTRQHIIQVGAQLILCNGFQATGINKVLDAAQVPKGSFYYYFSSKNDFGLAVIDDYARDYDQRLDETVSNPALTPLDRIRAYLEAASQDVIDCDFSKGCLIGNLGQELATQNEAFRSKLDTVFAGWERRFADCITEGQHAGEIPTDLDAAEAASLLLSGWQGAILRAKLIRSRQPLDQFQSLLFRKILTN
ncbi:TetR/AcrR family transcriptional regulator [Aquisalimonas asiatica]|nr:TetR/AcrR family transcriptional regulator [Aquisalimonas asiatica]